MELERAAEARRAVVASSTKSVNHSCTCNSTLLILAQTFSDEIGMNSSVFTLNFARQVGLVSPSDPPALVVFSWVVGERIQDKVDLTGQR